MKRNKFCLKINQKFSLDGNKCNHQSFNDIKEWANEMENGRN